MSVSFTPASTTGMGIFELFADNNVDIPMHVRTGQQSFGQFAERKTFEQLEFHSVGPISSTAKVRVYIDGKYISEASVTTTEDPNKSRKMNLPVGKNAGYVHDVEFCGAINLRALEFGINQMAGTS